MVRFDETVMMVRNLLHEENYIKLIGCLPDEFFQLNNLQKRKIFADIYSAINRGEQDPVKLVELVRRTMDQMVRSPAGINPVKGV